MGISIQNQTIQQTVEVEEGYNGNLATYLNYKSFFQFLSAPNLVLYSVIALRIFLPSYHLNKVLYNMSNHFLPALVAFCCTTSLINAQQVEYQLPPKVIADLVDAPLTPGVSLSPNHKTLLLMLRPTMPSIDEVSQEELRIGGLRINPRTNGASRSRHYVGLALQSITDDRQTTVTGLPERPRLENIRWSLNGNAFAFTHTTDDGLELWIVDVASGIARQLTPAIVNDAISGIPYTWLHGDKILVRQTVPNRGPAPIDPDSPLGPVVQENSAGASPVRTYQDLLKNPHDESLFEYYASSQLMMIDARSGASTTFADQGIYLSNSVSPDGNYVLISRVIRPFSYSVPYYRFAQEIIIYDISGQIIRDLASIPPAENIPKGFNAVRTGPRSFGWRHDKAASLYWVEAQDEGDPKNEVAVRDRLYRLDSPFNGKGIATIDFALRYNSITWGSGDLAVAHEYWWSTRHEIKSTWAPDSETGEKRVLFDRSYEDRYTDPGEFETTPNEYGRPVLMRGKYG
ncbi:MAG: hypothetical protein OEQ53_16180, partial [Saprospiraceae bacterium]|nr:hypothetical protein [Saprospiraceae bacterium]